MIRRFLTINPGMDLENASGQHCSSGVYISIHWYYEDSGLYDPRMEHGFNYYTKVFLSPRGVLRKYYGTVVWHCRDSFELTRKDVNVAKLTNRRIRYHANDEEVSKRYSYYKKLYGPEYPDW